MVRMRGAAGKLTYHVWDGWGRSTGTTFPGGASTLVKYDGNGNAVSARDELGRTTYREYDDANRMTGTVNPKGERQDYGYNANGWLGTVTDGNGHGREYAYNPRGDVYWLRLADGTIDYYSKSGRGEDVYHQRADGTVVYQGYDDAMRLKLTNYPGATGDESYVYDDDGRRTSMTDATGTTTWTIDDADRVTQLAQPYGTVKYEYNDADQRKKLTEVGSGDTVTTYDAAGRLWTIANRFGETTTFSYDPTLGLPLTKALANGTVETYHYDGRDRKDGITLKNAGGTVLRTESYHYTDASQIDTHTVDGAATSYGYDAAGQLQSETRPGYNGAYTYDANGNRLTRTVNGTTETLSYDAGDKLLAVKVGGATIRSYTYDAAGSAKTVTTSAGTTNVAWDEDERATGMSGPGMSGTYSYNGEGARLRATENGSARHEIRDGAGVTAPLLNDDQANYTPGISEYRAGVRTFLNAGVKNVGAQTSSAGAVSATRLYDAWGNVLASTGSFKGPFGYGGAYGYREDASGLKLLGHRLYDPSAGRFLSRDPARDGRNWYSYCGNDPVDGADPTGLSILGLVEILVAKGKKVGYIIVTDGLKEAEEVAVKLGGEPVPHTNGHGFPPGPPHVHPSNAPPEVRRLDVHITDKAGADAAEASGAQGWGDWENRLGPLPTTLLKLLSACLVPIEPGDIINAGAAGGNAIDPYVKDAAAGYRRQRIDRWLGDD